MSLGVVFTGTLLAILGEAMLLGDPPWGAAWIPLRLGLLLAVGTAGALVLGDGAWRAGLRRPARISAWLVAVALGLAACAVAALYVQLIQKVAAALEAPVVDPWAGTPLWVEAVQALLLAPLLEEWLCRGILWEAARRATTIAATLVLTAALFALLHGLEGGLLSLPHRFAGGLALGWLRWRHDSLGPPILAHLVWNAAALALGI